MTLFAKPTCRANRITIDGLALLGMTRHELVGIRYHTADPGNPPSQTAPPAAPPVAPVADPATPPATPPAPGTQPAAPATPPAAPAAPAAPVDPNSTTADPKTGTPQPPVGGVNFTDLPKETQDEVRRLRDADRINRERLRDSAPPEARAEVAKALGLEPEQSNDPVAQAAAAQALTTRAETAESGLAEAKRANMVLLQAPDANANAALLLDSKGFTESIAGLDPSDLPGIKAAIEKWVADHPAHAATPRTGLPPASAQRQQGAPRTASKTSLESAIGGAMAQQGQ